jgi:hypothetical protein
VRPARIEVEIEELVLHGLPPVHAERVREAVRRELESLVRARDPAVEGREVERADGGSFRPSRVDADGLGRGIARGVGRALTGGPGRRER